MSRFLTIQTRDDGSAIVRAADPDTIVGEFRAAMHALQFLSAVSLKPNNPEARAEEADRLQLYTIPLPDGPTDYLWFIFPQVHGLHPVPDEVVAKFASRDDAIMFVQFMRP